MQLRHSQRNICKEDSVLAATLHQVWERLCFRMGNLGTYRLLQINGQRKFFDPLDDSPPMVEGCEVFIGRIPRDMFEDELVPLFAHYGPIHELRLMMNFSGTNRGFAFAMYKQPHFAEEAIRKLNHYEVRPGHFIGVIPSVNNRRLYIGRLHPSSTNESNLLKFLSTLTEGLQSLSLHVMKKSYEKPDRKYAIAVYVSHRHAAMARRFLILRKSEVFQRDVIVDWACPNIIASKYARSGNGSDYSSNGNSLRPKASSSSCTPEIPKTAGAAPASALSRSPRLQADLADRQKKPPFKGAPKVTAKPEDSPKPNRPNEKLLNANKGLCYSRLSAPLYSLSPVPNSMLFLHSPPPKPKRLSELEANIKADPPRSPKVTHTDKPNKRNRKSLAAATHKGRLPAPASV